MLGCKAKVFRLIAVSVFLNSLGYLNPAIAAPVKADITHFPPFYVVNPNGIHSGVYLDIMVKTLQKAGLKYNVHSYPTKRLYSNLSSGVTDLFLGIKGSPVYHEHVYYSKMPVSHIQLRVYATGDTALPKIKEDLVGQSVIAMRGYGYAGLINYLTAAENDIDLKFVTSHQSSFLMLKNDRADYLLNYKHPSDRVLESMVVPGLKHMSLYAAEVFFIVSKNAPDALLLLDKLEAAYDLLRESGEIEYVEND